MSSTLPQRGVLTDDLLAYLRSHDLLTTPGILVGDQVAPDGAGWTGGGEPGMTSFVASVTLTTGVGLMGDAPDTMRSTHTSWKLVYGLRCTGGDRAQADFTADRARAAVTSYPDVTKDLGDAWVVQRVVFTRLGAMLETKSTDVPSYQISDNVEIWVTRSVR